MTTVAFVLVSWKPNAPAGMERAVAAACAGLTQLGHHALIITATPEAGTHYDGAQVACLTSLPVTFPCDDDQLRAAINTAEPQILRELEDLFAARGVDIAVYVDALWGLGRIMPTEAPTRRVLAAHVLGHTADVRAALALAPDRVIAPSSFVIDQAECAGYDTRSWRIVPNALLFDPPELPPSAREELRVGGPLRVLARLGPEKGAGQLLDAIPDDLVRFVEVALAGAGFESATGSQRRVLDECVALAMRMPAVTVLSPLPWDLVPGWLSQAGIVIVPSLKESFGLVALEAMGGGTPVVSYAVDNLPNLIGDGGVLVPVAAGPVGLWRAARLLLDEPVAYGAASQAGYYRARDYRPALIADQLLKVVS